MIASLRGYGKIARALLAMLGVLLIVGIVGSLWMSTRARASARDEIIHQAQAITDSSLSITFQPNDLSEPATAARATQLNSSIQAIVVDPSDFEDVTLYSPEGTILYSTQTSRIGNNLPGEKDAIKEALKGVPQTKDFDGTMSVLLPLRFRSGVGPPAAIELTHPDATVAAAAGPWRTNALFLFALLVLLGVAVFGVARLLSVVADPAAAEKEIARPMTIPSLQQSRAMSPGPGIREEGEARRRAEERARAAEDRLSLLQEQYGKTLEELQSYQALAELPRPSAPDPAIDERALRAEGQVRTLEQQIRTVTQEREHLASQLQDALRAPLPDPEDGARLREAELESISLRAALEDTRERFAEAQLEVDALRSASFAAPEIKGDLDAARVEVLKTKDALAGTEAQLLRAQRELEDTRGEIKTLRAEEQRAAMLEDEVRSAKAELESFRASHRADLVEREAELEEKVRATREGFQQQLEELEESYRSQLGQHEADLSARITDAETAARTATRDLESARADVEAARGEASSREEQLLDAHDEISRLRTELKDHESEMKERTVAVGQARKEADDMRRSLSALQADLARADEAVEQMRQDLESERQRATQVEDAAIHTERERASQQARAEKLVHQLEEATSDNAELNRRAQELEARRQLELAEDQGRAQIDDLLRVTQERLAGQTEKLITAEDRVKELELDLTVSRERLDVVEGDLRMHQMSEALRETREPLPAEAGVESHAASAASELAFEDRRATSPFMKELSIDAKRSLAQINALTQLLKHKKDPKDQAQLIKQLTAHARRLDHTVSDLAEADRLATGDVELQIKRTDMEALVSRVVEESMVDADHDVRIVAEPLKLRVDQLRTEQVLAGLLRISGERTQHGKTIVVRLTAADGGATLSVEDPEPSSDASVSPVVRRLAEVQGGKEVARRSGCSCPMERRARPSRPASRPWARRTRRTSRSTSWSRIPLKTRPTILGRPRPPIRCSPPSSGAWLSSATNGEPGRALAPDAAEDQGVALASPATDRRAAQLRAAAPHLVGERQHDPRAARADRMPERDRAAVHVHDRFVDAHHARRVEHDRGECLVDLHQPEVAGGEAGALQRLLHRERGHGVQRREPVGRHPVGHDLRQRLQTQPLNRFLTCDDDGARAVADLRGVARRDRPVGGERRLQLREPIQGGAGADALIALDDDGIAAALRHLDRHDLLGHQTPVPRRGSSLLRADRPGVLLRPVDPELRVHLVRARAHVAIVEGAPQAVVDHRVDHRCVTQARARACGRQQVRRVRHRLHAACDRDLELPGADHLVCDRDRGCARQAHLVDGEPGHLLRDTGGHGRLPGRDLALTRLQDVSHDGVLDPVGRDAGPAEGLPDHDRAQIDRAQGREPAAELPDRRPGAGHDERPRHGSSLRPPPAEPVRGALRAPSR